ncbi:MAG: ATP-binding cassette domain-containing protein [Halieaceae bacterium]|nr:ATP-binding cassette domain-containing protein [Halieaceae bacterium]
MLLFAWYFAVSRSLDEWLFAHRSGPVLWATALLLPLMAAMFWLRQTLRTRAGYALDQRLFQLLAGALQQHRRALIRQKPLSAWQDFHSRHLPAIESYLIDYPLQRRLVATLPLLVCLLIFPISWLAAVTLLITMPLIPVFMWLVGRGTAALQERHILALDRLGSIFGDRLLGRRTIRLHNAASREQHRFNAASRSLNDKLAAVLRVAFLSTSVLEFFSTLSIALVAVFVGFALLGEVTMGFYGTRPSLGEALFVLLVAPAFFAELKALGQLYHRKSEAQGALSAWSSVLQQALEHRPVKSSDQQMLDNVVFNESQIMGFEGAALLSVPELSLHRGDRVLLTGPSGGGKTVLLEALAGLRRIEGSVKINGEAVDDLGVLRESTLLLDQTPTLFPGSVRSNVGMEQHSDADITESLRRVGLQAWLDQLPQGLETKLGDIPALSGGQRQRLAVARLLLFSPALVLLDEPTAHLSPEERDELALLLRDALIGKTVVWASHDPQPSSWFSQHWRLDTTVHPAAIRINTDGSSE